MFLKKVFLTAIIIFALLLANISSTNAESYLVNIRGGDSESGRWVSVTENVFRNGKFVGTTHWNFDDFRHSGKWRYTTDTMKGHTCRVVYDSFETTGDPRYLPSATPPKPSESEIILRYCLWYLGMKF